MAAENKSELIAVTQKEYGKLNSLIEPINSASAEKKDRDDTSIKDIIAHRAHWIDLFLGWHADGLARKTVYFPAEGYKWNDLKRYNADLRQQQSGLDWEQAKSQLRASYGRLSDFLEKLSNEELYGGPMKGANNQWTPGRWAEAAGPSHFRSASKYIRARLRKSA